MKRLIIISSISVAVVFFGTDYLTRRPVLEVGTVIYKDYAAPRKYGLNDSTIPVNLIVVVQIQEGNGYFIGVPKEYFDGLDLYDKVPLTKEYGRLTGYEYKQQLKTTNR